MDTIERLMEEENRIREMLEKAVPGTTEYQNLKNDLLDIQKARVDLQKADDQRVDQNWKRELEESRVIAEEKAGTVKVCKLDVDEEPEIAAKYEGILTDEKVQQMMNDFAPTHDLHGLNAMYLYQNATQSAAFSRFSDKEGNWNGLSVSDVFGNEEIKIGYVDGWLSTSKNMVRVFIVLALAVIIMLAPIFSGEYEGVDNIILTSKYGKTKCATAKVAAGILTAILTTALVAAFNLLLALIFYGTEGLDCSILFAPSDYVEGFIPFNITCGTLLKYQILLAFTCTLSVTGITLLISAISKNQIVAFVASMTIFLFPVLLPITEANPLFRLIGLLPLYHVQAVSLLSVEQMNNGMLYAVWAIPTALVFLGIGAVISRRVFAKHQVS